MSILELIEEEITVFQSYMVPLRSPTADCNLAVPQHLKELYEVYLREQEEGNLERATMMDRLASRALQVGARAGQCAPVLGAGLMPRAAPASK